MSYTTNPVTQVAEVAVKSASINGVNSPLLDDIGKDKTIAPDKIIAKKPIALNLARLN